MVKVQLPCWNLIWRSRSSFYPPRVHISVSQAGLSKEGLEEKATWPGVDSDLQPQQHPRSVWLVKDVEHSVIEVRLIIGYVTPICSGDPPIIQLKFCHIYFNSITRSLQFLRELTQWRLSEGHHWSIQIDRLSWVLTIYGHSKTCNWKIARDNEGYPHDSPLSPPCPANLVRLVSVFANDHQNILTSESKVMQKSKSWGVISDDHMLYIPYQSCSGCDCCRILVLQVKTWSQGGPNLQHTEWSNVSLSEMRHKVGRWTEERTATVWSPLESGI